MQQVCSKCGYESPESDKFCRQCGGQIATESEFTSATTLNHGKAEPNPPVVGVGTGRFSPSIGDAIGGDTERYYTPPQYSPPPITIERPQAPAPATIERPPTYALINPNPPAPSRFDSFSRFMKGVFIFLLFAGFVTAVGAAVFWSQEAMNARRRNNELENGRARSRAENANSRAQDAWSQMEEALQLAQEAAERASNAGATLTLSDDKSVDLSKYAFPDAQVEGRVDSQGNEALSLLTRKDFNEVQKFYERLMGNPVLQVAADYRGDQIKKLLFQSSTLPSILVKVEEVEIEGRAGNDRLQVKITILHSFLRFPRFNEAAQNLK
jgi:hypothetical protein